jgi:hypothetical protein
VTTRALSPRRVWLLATAALLLAFVAGGLSGAAWERYQHAHRHATVPREQRFREMLQRRYGLSDQQAVRIDAIVRRRRPRVDSLMATVEPQMRAAFDSTNAEIRALLNPAQRVKFDRDQEAHRRRSMGRFPGPRPPGPPPAR